MIAFTNCIWIYLIFSLYKKEVARQKDLVVKMKNDNKSIHEKLDDSFRYIGQVNVQIQQIKSIFSSSDRFPKTKNDFKKTLLFYSERIFGIVNIELGTLQNNRQCHGQNNQRAV